MSSRRVSRSRRALLKALPAALAAPAARARPAQAAPQPPIEENDIVSADDLGVAQEIVGLHLPLEEREKARPLVVRNREHYERLRQVEVGAGVEPAFCYRPPRPPAAGRPPAAAARTTQLPPVRVRFGNLEDLAFAPITTLAPLLASRRITSVDLTRMYLDRLARLDPTLHCVVTLTADLAMEQASEADKEIRAGRYRGPLHGIPYGIKDLFATRGIPTTWGAAPYADQVFDYDATAVVRLREAGAVLVAKLSTGELAIGDLWFRARTRNPWNPSRGSSGSSAGPAAATAAGLVGFAVGTETNGSIVSPANACGVVGLRPTYGRISRFGCMTLRWTLDKVGPMTRSVRDAGLVLEALYGPDGRDATVADVPFAWSGRRRARGLRIGYVERELLASESERDAQRRPFYEAALEVYRAAGATLVPITLPALPAASMYAVLNAEAGAMFDDLTRSGRHNELADTGQNGRANQLRAARFIPAVEYIRAQRVRTLLLEQMNALLADVDLFLAPPDSDSVTMSNLTGHPAVVLPAGMVDGMPIGIMLTGRLWDEETLLAAASAFEAATRWHEQHPRL